MNELEKRAKKLAEEYWKTFDWRKWTLHGMVVLAFVEGYKAAKGDDNQ